MTSSTPTIKGILVLEQMTGARINAKYFASELVNAPEKQLAFEKKLHAKSIAILAGTVGIGDVLMLDNNLVLFSGGSDVIFYVMGSHGENELILMCVLEAITDTLRSVLRGHVDKSTILDNLELLLLTIDEVVDQGSILETDPTVLARRVMLRNPDGTTSVSVTAGPNNATGNTAGALPGGMADLTLAGALNAARDHLVRLSRA